jgi:hypothetical protein
MSSRGKLKKRNKAYEERMEQITIGYYKRHLDIMIERELGITLTKWQKFLLKRVQKGIK